MGTKECVYTVSVTSLQGSTVIQDIIDKFTETEIGEITVEGTETISNTNIAFELVINGNEEQVNEFVETIQNQSDLIVSEENTPLQEFCTMHSNVSK